MPPPASRRGRDRVVGCRLADSPAPNDTGRGHASAHRTRGIPLAAGCYPHRMRFAYYGSVSDSLASFADRLSGALQARGYERTDDLATANLVLNFVDRANVDRKSTRLNSSH